MTWLIDLRDMIHSYIWHGPLIYVTWLIHIHDTTHWCIWDDSWISATWRTRIYALFLFVNEDSLYTWHDTLMYVKCLIHIRDVTHCCKGDDSFANQSLHIYMNSAWIHHVTNMKIFMSYIWTSEYPVTRMMGTHSFSLIFFSPTQSIFHICFFTHSWMGTQPFFHSLMNEYSPIFQGTQTFLQVFVITLSWMSECLVTHMKSVTASHVTQFKSHIWTNEGMSWCHAYEAWVLLFAFNESYHTCEWVNALSHT